MSASGRPRGPWLASGLCCPAGSSLTMASSEALGLSRRLPSRYTAGLCPRAKAQSVPTFICMSLPPCRLPYPGGRTGLRLLAVPSVLAFAQSRGARHPRHPGTSRFTPGKYFGAAKVRVGDPSPPAAAWMLARPSPTRAFTFELSPRRSPGRSVEYDYAGKQSIPATGLSPAGQAALWAASESSRNISSNILIKI